MGTLILWTIIGILFVTNPALFFLGIILFVLYKGFCSQPNKFGANQASSPGPDQKEEEQDRENTREDPMSRFTFKNEDDPEVIDLRNSLRDHINKKRAQADEDLLSEAEREYAARKRAEELGQAIR